MIEFLSQLNEETRVLMVLSVILFSGFIMTRLTNTLNMPKVSGYILAGILIGPCCLNFVPKQIISSMSFVSDLALAFIAFGIGKFFKKEVLLRTGKKIVVITLSEALAAGVLVTLLLKLIFNLSWDFALILGAIATATAPASTMMTINQYKAKGEFVDTLLQIVALDDVVCLLAFSIVSAVINGNAAGSLSARDILIPIAYNFLMIALGVFCGYFLSRLLIPARSRDNRLILAIAMLLGLSGICAAIDISPLLSCMVFGAVYINLTRDKKLFRQINNFTPPVMSIFFIVSGMNLDLNALTTVGAIGVSYFLIRIVGKYMGTYISCLVMKTSPAVRNYMGLALIPQAGVAIGLAFLGQRMLPPETAGMMLTIILSSSVLYEMVGPVSAKAALFLSGSITHMKDPAPEGIEIHEADEEELAAELRSQEEENEPSAKSPSQENVQELLTDSISGEDGQKSPSSPHSQDQEHELHTDDGSAKRKHKRLEGSRSKDEPHKSRTRAFSKAEDHECHADPHSSEDEHEDEEIAAVLPELREYSKGVDENDYDIEKELKPTKTKKKKKHKKASAKLQKAMG